MNSNHLKKSSIWRKTFRSASTTTETANHQQRDCAQPQTLKLERNTLEHKYGKPDKILTNGGAGGSILLVTRQRDNITFAVKRFKRRLHYEDEQSYARKIVAEYYVGARLRHPNIIKTFDLFEEHGSWLAVMEYAPFCLFDRVTSRMMSIVEINCAFMQILSGTSYLHDSGFAHRDLKLENVVITENGVMKIIDFGSAIMCREPGRKTASGFVGSISYMAPEAAAALTHDPQKADVWSLAIIYCCMVLGRFPWRTPDRFNEAFMLFAATESLNASLAPSHPPSRTSSTNSVTVINVTLTEDSDNKQKTIEKVLGPWGLLRQLPGDSREVIKAMLTINPNVRPTMQQVGSTPWIADARYCTEDESGKFEPVDGHRHT